MIETAHKRHRTPYSPREDLKMREHMKDLRYLLLFGLMFLLISSFFFMISASSLALVSGEIAFLSLLAYLLINVLFSLIGRELPSRSFLDVLRSDLAHLRSNLKNRMN